MDKNEDSAKADDLDICCGCFMCQHSRMVSGVAEPTKEQRHAAVTRLLAGNGVDRNKTMQHSLELLMRKYPSPQPQPIIDWVAQGAERRFVYKDWSKASSPRPTPAQTKAQLTLEVFDQLEALINDAGWNDSTDKAIALLRLQECRLLWESDNAGEGL